MIIQTKNSSFLLDKVRGFYLESDLDYNLSTEKYDLKGYTIWAAMPKNDIRVTGVMPKEEAEEKLNSLTKFWGEYTNDIVYEL